MGNVPNDILLGIKTELEAYLNVKCRIMGRLQIPKESLNQWRKQYDAEKVMTILSDSSEAKFIDKNIPSLMITDKDLYYGGLNFVFGLEDPAKSSAIVSISRLRPEFYDEPANVNLLKERIIKEVIHEMGHYMGLDHCHRQTCVMRFSPSISDVDEKKKRFCDDCRIKLLTSGIRLREFNA